MLSPRMKDLLIKASVCFEEGFSPFTGDWLSENQVTFDECMSLSELIGAIIKGFALSDADSQAVLFMVSVSDGKITSSNARLSVEDVRLQKRLRNVNLIGSSTSLESTLTMESFEKMLDEFFPILLYGTAEYVKPGEIYYCEETDLSPEYIVCHPSDLERIKTLLPFRRLIHIKDEAQNMIIERIKNKMVDYCKKFIE